MTKDNHQLGKFELTNIPPAPRGVPQIEVSFEIDTDGILQVSASDKGTGKSQKITIKQEKGRLSEEDIERMVREAEEFAEEDKKTKDRIDARNGLESYLYGVKNSLEDEKSGLGDKIEESDKSAVEEAVRDALEWLDENQEEEAEEYNDKKKEVQTIVDPILREAYGTAEAPDSARDDYEEAEDEDFDEEL